MTGKTRQKLYPLTAHGYSHREFIQRWHSLLTMFAEINVRDGVPGRPDRMDYSGALLAVKAGHLATRAGWFGVPQYVCLQDGYPDGIGINANTAAATGWPEGTVVAFEPYLTLVTAGHHTFHGGPGTAGVSRSDHLPVMGRYTPTDADQLADDWQIFPRPGTPEEPDDADADPVAQLMDRARARHEQ